MSNLSRRVLLALVLALSLAGPVSAWAKASILSGSFDGYEPQLEPVFAQDCTDAPTGYQKSTFRVSQSGTYYFNDGLGALRSLGGLDVTALVYAGSFDEAAPEHNLLAIAGLDYPAETVELTAGETYSLVVQLACAPSRGAWAVMFVGPGAVESAAARELPAFTTGEFHEGGPTMYSNCSDAWGPYRAYYQESGPIQVSRDGAYYFATAGIHDGLCLSIYSAPVNPAKEWLNRLGAWDYGYTQKFELKAGRDYYILVQSNGSPYAYLPGVLGGFGEYSFILAPPAPFRINFGLADAWYNPEIPGQGFFLDVFESINQLFLGWFTYAPETPSADAYAHRWMTAIGAYRDRSAQLAIDWAAGGGFDAAQPAPEHLLEGNIELQFTDCDNGEIHYAWSGEGSGQPPRSGVIPIRRVVKDPSRLCESLYAGPGEPGRL